MPCRHWTRVSIIVPGIVQSYSRGPTICLWCHTIDCANHPRLDFQICCWQDIYLHRSQHLEQVAVFCAQCSISVCFQKGTQISSVSTNVIFGYEFLLCFSFVFCFYLCIFLCHRAVIFGNGALKKPLVCMYVCMRNILKLVCAVLWTDTKINWKSCKLWHFDLK